MHHTTNCFPQKKWIRVRISGSDAEGFITIHHAVGPFLLRNENRHDSQGEAGVILNFNQEDIREEIELMDSCPAKRRLL